MSLRRTKYLVPAGIFVLIVAGFGGYIAYWRGVDEAELRAAELALVQRDFDDAGNHYLAYLDRHPDHLPVRLSMARTARRGMDYNTARAHLEIYERSSGDAQALQLEYRLTALQRGNLYGVEELFDRCATLPAAEESPLILEAVIVGSLNALAQPLTAPEPFLPNEIPVPLLRCQRAVEMWLASRTGPADQVQGLVWRGRVRGLSADHDGSIADLRRALDLDPNHFEARAYLALTIAQQNPIEAAGQFEILLRRAPGNQQLRFALASGRRGMGDLAEARRLLDEILASDENLVMALIERGQVELDERRPVAAEPWLERARALAPNTPELYLALARCKQLQAKPDEAKQFQERFHQLDQQRHQDRTPRLFPPGSRP
jgi:tetratricopeptide (TPR) repeat protein